MFKSCEVHGTLGNWNYLVTDKDNHLTKSVFYSAGRHRVYILLLPPGWRVFDRERKEYMPYGVIIGFVRGHSNAFGACQKKPRSQKPQEITTRAIVVIQRV